MAHFCINLVYSFHSYYGLVFFLLTIKIIVKTPQSPGLRLREGKYISNHTYVRSSNNNVHLIVSGFIFWSFEKVSHNNTEPCHLLLQASNMKAVSHRP